MDLTQIKELYTSNIREFGIDPRSVGWGTQDKQDLRFKKLLGVVSDPQKYFSISELGCGYGQLVKYCQEQKFNLRTYHGYDISPEMVDAAQRYIQNDFSFFYESAQILHKADFVISSGIFNVAFDAKKDQWEHYIKETILHMFAMCERGISMNFLTKYVDWETKDLYYADPSYYFDFAKKNLSKYVNLIHDYPLYEFTLQVLK